MTIVGRRNRAIENPTGMPSQTARLSNFSINISALLLIMVHAVLQLSRTHLLTAISPLPSHNNGARYESDAEAHPNAVKFRVPNAWRQNPWRPKSTPWPPVVST
ncbi:hypothetical protein M758_UG132200 [Ceratodon purpureus]|nr:hypothetical protein M758_UG132200 [Ceratodon purpureus]